MNKAETAYSGRLELLRSAGEVLAWEYEGLKFRLGNNCTLTPDFVVVTPEQMEIHEVKGRREDDAMAKFRMAAERYWYFRWLMLEKNRGEWRTILDL